MMNTEKLTTDQIREAKIRMEGEHAIKRKIKDKIMTQNPNGPCAYCGKPSEGNFSVHRDDSCTGPVFPLCDECGDEDGPSLQEIRRKLFMRTEPVMDIEDELTKLRKENDDLRDRLLSVVRGAKDERERLHAQIVHMQKRIEELEGALKAKLLEHVSKHGH